MTSIICHLVLVLSLRSGIWKWTQIIQLRSTGAMDPHSPCSNINILADNHHPLEIIFKLGMHCDNVIQFKNLHLLMMYC